MSRDAIPGPLREALAGVMDPLLRKTIAGAAGALLAPDPRRDEAKARADELQRLAEERDARLDRKRRLAECELPVPDEDIAMLVRNALDDSYEPLVAVKRLLAEIDSGQMNKPYLVLGGTVGVGKTVAAGHAIASRDGVFYIRANDLIAIHASRDRDDKARVRALQRAPIAIVDEAGTELDARRWKIASFELVDSRQGQRRATIFAGNVTNKDFAARLDSRTVSRMQGRTAWVEVSGDDMRSKRLA